MKNRKRNRRNRWPVITPSAEDIARATAAMEESQRGLGDVSSQIKKCYPAEGLHDAYLFYSERIDSFHALLFYRQTKQIKDGEASGQNARIRQSVLDGLVKAGRGTLTSIKLEIEWDSDEKVQSDYGGNYFFRLR